MAVGGKDLLLSPTSQQPCRNVTRQSDQVGPIHQDMILVAELTSVADVIVGD
jgi:hypothetical protein